MADFTVRRISALAGIVGATRYLEVGIWNGDTFNAVPIPERTGVDVDLSHYREPSAGLPASQVLLEMSSDDFFAEQASGLYDVIFLDGLHTAEQTFRDFCGSLRFSHPRTVWLIDDTLPATPLSAVRDWSRWTHLRALLGSEDERWHGDVFRVVPMIRDAFRNLAAVTIVDRGNPQTVVWSAHPPQPPAGLRWAQIGSLEYFDLLEDPSLLNCATEEEALELVRSTIHR